MPESYLDWCEKLKTFSALTDGIDIPGVWLNSANSVKVVDFDSQKIVQKIISPGQPYIPRIKALGEIACALLDYHLSPENRVTPNVYASSPMVIWRQFILGEVGELWRENLHTATRNLDQADLLITGHINSPSAERIALLDFIFLCQDRSGRNWLKSDKQFWAIDNAMFWPYHGRFADKETIKTGKVKHLQHPIKALIYIGNEFKFRNGIFSSLWAGRNLSGELYHLLTQIDWEQYFYELGHLICAPLVYPFEFIDDWRFWQLQQRAEWILERRRLPDANDIEFWQLFITQPLSKQSIWRREWEIWYLEKM